MPENPPPPAPPLPGGFAEVRAHFIAHAAQMEEHQRARAHAGGDREKIRIANFWRALRYFAEAQLP